MIDFVFFFQVVDLEVFVGYVDVQGLEKDDFVCFFFFVFYVYLIQLEFGVYVYFVFYVRDIVICNI